MNKQKSPIISHENEILLPRKGKAYDISTSEWNYLKEKIKRIEPNVPFFNNLGYTLIGIGISFALATIITDLDNYYCYIISVLIIGSGILSLYFSSEQIELIITYKNDVIEEMDHIQSRYPNNKT